MSDPTRRFHVLDLPVADLPLEEVHAFVEAAHRACDDGARISAYLALPRPDAGDHELFLVLAHDEHRRLSALRGRLRDGEALPCLTPSHPQAQGFERELHEIHGIPLSGHPWPKPLRAHAEAAPRSGPPVPEHPFFRIEGEGLHEVAVGPVHAGVIEPGHFRFQCEGERVLFLEIQLGYQHRGLEALLLDAPPARRMVLAESIAGDTVLGHGLAWCRCCETLSGREASPAAERVRTVALELERLANHVGDLGALCGDVAFLPGASYYGRIRARFLNLLIRLSGNRFGRGLLTPGGVWTLPDRRLCETLLESLAVDEEDLRRVSALTFDSSSVLSRFEGTGAVSKRMALDLGLVGPVARACGLARDLRRDHPAPVDLAFPVPSAVAEGGDVMARARVRRDEIFHSLARLRSLLSAGNAEGPKRIDLPRPRPGRLAAALVEGWRGEIAHVSLSDDAGRLRAHKIVDPSFHDWFGLAMALRGEQISDFPLCNKSFNLSYAGHDL